MTLVSCLQRVQDRDALEAVSATLEGRTEKQKNPHPPGAFAAWADGPATPENQGP